MKRTRAAVSLVVALGALVFLAGAALTPQAAQAGAEDAAIFYDELSQYGSWIDDEQYGPVWYPNQVDQDWRPYVNGRWVPSKQGYLFETEEPWGWATYHYGNWMPTEGYGWVWAPGRTWYPSTVTWRNTPETVPVDSSYIGWAPIPPPNYVPPPNTGWYPTTGWAPGQPVLNALTAPFWVFSQAASFLLGFGQPFTPAYSYTGCGCLAPPAYYPVVYPGTRMISNWYYPSYYPATMFGGGAVLGAYNWGPPTPYITRVTNVNQTTINNYINNYNVSNVRNGLPPDVVYNRHRGVFDTVAPPRDVNRWGNPMRVQNANAIINRNQIGNPGAIVKPANLTALDTGRIPKGKIYADPAGSIGGSRGGGQMGAGGEGRGMKGFGIGSRAQQQITPEMSNRIGKSGGLKGAEGFTGMGGRGMGAGQPGLGRGPAMGAVEGQPGGVSGRGMGRGQVGQEGFQGPGRRGAGEGAGIGRGPGRQGPGMGAVEGQPGMQQGLGRGGKGRGMGPGGPAVGAVEGQPGAGSGRGQGRGPVTKEGFQGPVRRGPGEGPGVRRGPDGAMPEGMPGARVGPGEGPGKRRGPGAAATEGFQPPGRGTGGAGLTPSGQPGMGPGRKGSGREGMPGPGMGQGQPGMQQGPAGQGRRQGGPAMGSPGSGQQRGPGSAPGGQQKMQQQPGGMPPGSQNLRGPGGAGRMAGPGAGQQIQRGPTAGGGGPKMAGPGPGGGGGGPKMGGGGPQMNRAPGGGGQAPKAASAPPPQQSRSGGGGGQKAQQQGKKANQQQQQQ